MEKIRKTIFIKKEKIKIPMIIKKDQNSSVWNDKIRIK